MKPLDAFYRCATNGASPYCKPCSADYKRKGDKTRAQITADVYPSEGTRRCAGCLDTKPIEAFNIARSGKIRPRCKLCQYEGYKAWAERKTGEPLLPKADRCAAQRARRFPTPDTAICSACKSEKPLDQFGVLAGGAVRRQCKKCRSLVEAASYAARKVEAAVKRAAYKANNLDRLRAYARAGAKRRRAAKAGVDVTLTEAEWLGVLDRYGHRCLRCGATERLSIDHVVPISKGGAHSVENVQPLCIPCNSSKHTKIIDYRAAA